MEPQWHLPLDPACPNNPMTGFFSDPITQACGCADELASDMEARHRRNCRRCAIYGTTNIEVAEA